MWTLEFDILWIWTAYWTAYYILSVMLQEVKLNNAITLVKQLMKSLHVINQF